MPAWPDEFKPLGAALRRALGGLALRIDHIGSTSVRGLASKDIIDIQVTVRSRALTVPLVQAIAAAGYILRTDITRDHRPPRDSRPLEEWTKLYFGPPKGQRPTHLHVRAANRANQRYALLFRDYLRASPSAAAAYAELKRQLARHHPRDAEAYYEIKDPACDIVMAGAEAWARAVGWTPGPSDA